MKSFSTLVCLVTCMTFVACDRPTPIPAKPTTKKAINKTPAVSKTKASGDKLGPAGVDLAILNAKTLAWRGLAKSFDRGMVHANQQLIHQKNEAGTARPDLSKAQPLTILFSGNNHGEREDCGCKFNPLGGLDRRSTLIKYANTPKAAGAIKYWGKDLPDHKAVFVVDSGESLFKDANYSVKKPEARELADKMATAVILSMNVTPPDAFGVGERELAMGKDGLLSLQKKAKFPFISANLADMTGKLVFPPSVVVERGGKKVGFIAITRSRARYPEFYQKMKLKVLDAVQAYEKTVQALPKDLDAVVLLSTEGIGATDELIKKLNAKNMRVDVAIVSGSNRLTKKPLWSMGTPMVEPMSRGKYFGRLDMYQNSADRTWHFSNDTPDIFSLMKVYSRAFKAYVQTTISLLQDKEEIVHMKVNVLKRQSRDKTGQKALETYYLPGEIKKREKMQRRIGLSTKRLALFDKSTAEAVRNLNKSIAAPKSKGTDWIDVRVIPVALTIPQDKKVRKVLDKYKDAKFDESKLH